MEDSVKIYEDKYEKKDFTSLLSEVNTKEEQKKARFYLRRLENLISEMEEREENWNELQKMYKGEREKKEELDTEFRVNIVLPNIEGQVASMTNNKPTAHFKGVGYSDQKFARTANTIIRTVFNVNDIRGRAKRAIRRYNLFGNTIMSVGWNPNIFDGFGLPQIDTPQITRVYVDSKIKDLADLQDAEYIIETMPKSIMWAKRKFGEEKANAIQVGNTEPVFQSKYTTDDEDTFTYIRVWTRNNEEENLQLIELSLCGVFLDESDSSKPYYKYVDNKYPYFFAGLYTEEGELYRFGDGQVLKPLQEMIDKLYDEIILAVAFASQGRTYIDSQARVNINEFMSAKPHQPIMAKNPNAHIKTEQGAGINPVVFNLLEQLFQKVQELTRFSSLMTGNSPESNMTATQAGIQMKQGVSGIDDKKKDISKMIADVAKYSIGLCMEFWSAAKALRVSDDEDSFEWVDARQLARVPVMIPASNEYIRKYKEMNPHDKEVPQFQQLEYEDEEGNKKPATKVVELDTEVSIGEGLPTNKMALYNIILSLSQIRLLDEETGQERSLMSYQQTRQMAEDLLGIKIDDVLDKKGQPTPQMQTIQNGQANMQGGQAPNMNMDFDVPNANSKGVVGNSGVMG